MNVSNKELQEEIVKLGNGAVKLHIVNDGSVITVG